MRRDELDDFADVARELCAFLMQAGEIPLEQRVYAVYRGLSQLLAFGAVLPVHPGELPRSPPPFDFPGFGSYEAYWTVGPLSEPGQPVPLRMSETLHFVFAGLWAGLEAYEGGDRDAAAGTWGRGFEEAWGIAASELVHALHPVVAAYRNDLRRETRGRRPVTPVLVQQERKREPPSGLGVEMQPVPGGLEVLDVHPDGISAGQLQPGDLILSIDGTPVDALDPATLTKLPLKFEVYRDGETVYARVG